MRKSKEGYPQQSLAELIYNVLYDNRVNGKNNFLTDSAISIRVMNFVNAEDEDGNPENEEDKFYGKIIQPKTIRSQMGAVRTIGDESGVTIIARRKKEGKNGDDLKGWIITGWRFADKGDEKHIHAEIELRANRRNGYSNSALRISNNAKSKGILPKNDNQVSIEE